MRKTERKRRKQWLLKTRGVPTRVNFGIGPPPSLDKMLICIDFCIGFVLTQVDLGYSSFEWTIEIRITRDALQHLWIHKLGAWFRVSDTFEIRVEVILTAHNKVNLSPPPLVFFSLWKSNLDCNQRSDLACLDLSSQAI